MREIFLHLAKTTTRIPRLDTPIPLGFPCLPPPKSLIAKNNLQKQYTRNYSILATQYAPVTFAKTSNSSYESISSCPDPTCKCAETPLLREPIDRAASIRESAPGYVQHVVIHTGQGDWSSRIEDEGILDGEIVSPEPPSVKDRFKSVVKRMLGQGGLPRSRELHQDGVRKFGLARGLKTELGRRGSYFEPMRPMLITNSSFAPPSFPVSQEHTPTVSASLFPSFTLVSQIPDTRSGHEDFIRTFLLDSTAGSSFQQVPAVFKTHPITHPVILICSHGTRDARCGVLGPVLASEFRRQLANAGVADFDEALKSDGKARVSIGLVSHIGGHKWAGNLIVYLPPRGTGSGTNAQNTALAGKGVWYGRVEPRHVEGIVKETVLRGRVIEELCRGIRG